jgi:Holliday junction resolvasome RuvABC endonuclease subunit
LAFYGTLKEFIGRNGIRKIVTEDINFNAHHYDYRKLNEMRGIVQLLTEELGLLPVEFTNVRVLKKWATGSGVATKEEVMAACVNRYRFHPADSNEADAFMLFHHYCRKWRID